jgi:hypothetical protein
METAKTIAVAVVIAAMLALPWVVAFEASRPQAPQSLVLPTYPRPRSGHPRRITHHTKGTDAAQ